MKYLGLNIDLERDNLFDEYGLKRLKESYMLPEETSPQQRFAYVAKKFGTDAKHSQRLYDYASKHWLSFSTPILSHGRSKRGLPISCFLSYLDDSSEGLVTTLSEVNTLSMLGGGVGIGVGIRAADEKSTGVMPHLKIYDASCLAYTQSGTRRGTYATYLDLDHPDILKYLDMRKATGDYNIRCMNLHQGVNIPDRFMEIIERCQNNKNENDDWELKDKASGVVKEVVSAKWLWQKILELRMMTGEPYLFFIDTANKNLPKWLSDKGLEIRQSNICSEIGIPTDKDRTAVCCLSSLNLNYYDDWKNNKQFIRDVAEMLDNVLTIFIEKAPDAVKRAVYSASRGRDIGIGVLGFHTYLQKKCVPFESAMAKGINISIFRHIKTEVDAANLDLGSLRGEAPDCVGTGRRFSMSMAIAPTASTSIIMGNISPSIEPMRANAYRQDTLSGAFLNKNRNLDELIKRKCSEDAKLDYDEVWSSIISNDGSVQHLKLLTEDEKDVYKTAMELDMRWVIELAADRQKYIDQFQSLNLFFRPNANVKYLHYVHFNAWKLGIRTLYYCRSEKLGKTDKIAKKIEREIIESISSNDECLACQ